MNIFHLDDSAITSARMLCDKHVPKMLLETCQMLSTAVRNQIPQVIKGDAVYKSAYPKHPMTIWVGDSYKNFLWTLEHGKEINKQFNSFKYLVKSFKQDAIDFILNHSKKEGLKEKQIFLENNMHNHILGNRITNPNLDSYVKSLTFKDLF